MTSILGSAVDAVAQSDRDPVAGLQGWLRPALRGAVGGVVATVAMTVYRIPLFRALPPTAEFLARVAAGDPSAYPLRALALHLTYGAAAGGVFGVAFSRVRPDSPDRRGRLAMLAGLAYGLALSAFGSRVLLARVVGTTLDADEALVFHAGHVVYGLALGTWVGTEGGIGRSEDGD